MSASASRRPCPSSAAATSPYTPRDLLVVGQHRDRCEYPLINVAQMSLAMRRTKCAAIQLTNRHGAGELLRARDALEPVQICCGGPTPEGFRYCVGIEEVRHLPRRPSWCWARTRATNLRHPLHHFLRAIPTASDSRKSASRASRLQPAELCGFVRRHQRCDGLPVPGDDYGASLFHGTQAFSKVSFRLSGGYGRLHSGHSDQNDLINQPTHPARSRVGRQRSVLRAVHHWPERPFLWALSRRLWR